MTITFDSRIDIGRPLPDVFATLTDVGSWPRWASTVESFVQITPPPMRVGSRLLHVSRRGARRVETPFEVTALASNELFALASAALRCSFELAAQAASTRITARFEVDTTGKVAILYRPMLKRWVAGDLRKFGTYAEMTISPGLTEGTPPRRGRSV
jgi:hypothetical protein